MNKPEPKVIKKKLKQREKDNSRRQLKPHKEYPADFSSNDYLGFSKSEEIQRETENILQNYSGLKLGTTGSRLLSGNHQLFEPAENFIAGFHNSKSALLFNSGFNANLGLLSALPQRNDLIFYDELSHASIRQGVRLSMAKAIKFKHNDLPDLKSKIERFQNPKTTCYIATESVFSMDGDSPELEGLVDLCEKKNCHLILDEAHALGVIGNQGRGLAEKYKLENRIFARVVTFGKAMGAHGAAVLGSENLREFLINFSANFIYTTALSPRSVAHILAAYRELQKSKVTDSFQYDIKFFREVIEKNNLSDHFLNSTSAIQSCVIPGNSTVKSIAKDLQEKGSNVRPVLSPTVPKGQERLRFCLHVFLQPKQIANALKILRINLSSSA